MLRCENEEAKKSQMQEKVGLEDDVCKWENGVRKELKIAKRTW